MKRLAPSRFIIVVAISFSACVAHADVQRFAVIMGNNQGDNGDTPLHFAESDATRVYELLRDLGGFSPVNMVLLKGEDARTAEDTLIAVNERVRAALGHPGSQALLFVYYSGHADPDALHLGSSRLPARLLSQLVSGSAATFRLLVLDACRLGAVTRTKGGHIVKGTKIVTEETLPGSGIAVLAASASHEDAQESEEIKGSFFTHAFVSGLMGAADQDHDGAVSLSEAYHYAYNATLRETSRTIFGTQHPTFRFDFGGQGALVLTRPQDFADSRAVLRFPPGIGFLVMRDSPDGIVVGEIGPTDKSRLLSVRPGHFFIRGRGEDVLYEGRFELNAAKTTYIDQDEMNRIEYARLVRKGGTKRSVSHDIEVGPWVRTALSNAQTACAGGFLGYSIDFEYFGLQSRVGACTSDFSNEHLDATVNEYDLELRVAHSWDVSFLSIGLSLGGAAALFTQRFNTRGSAPPRDSFSPYVLMGCGIKADIGSGYGVGVGVTGETHFLRLDSDNEEDRKTSGELALRVNAAFSKSF